MKHIVICLALAFAGVAHGGQLADAKGSKTAAPEMAKQRELRRADMDYWISKYDGADLKGGTYRCPAPRFPPVSKMNEEIISISASMTTWQTCYNAFVDNLQAQTPLTKRIPADIARLLNEQEMAAAKAHLDDVLERIAADASINAKLVLADFAAWRSATEKYVAEHNAVVSSTSTTRSADLEARKNNYQPTK